MVPLERRLEKVLYGFSYAVTDQTLKINTEKKVISLNLQIDTDICSMYEYFEIFLDVHGTFDALLLDLAAQFIRRLDVAAVLDVIGMAAAAAEELGPAVAADGLVEDVQARHVVAG